MRMDAARWARLGRMPIFEAAKLLATDPLPSALSRALPGSSWAPHGAMAACRERPGSLIALTARLPNGMGATAVYGGDEGFHGPSGRPGPWTLSLGLAACVGDEGRSEMLACFSGADRWPRLAGEPLAFAQDGPGVELGGRAAFVELDDPRAVAEALSLLAGLPSAWDDTRQAALWEAARAGRGACLARMLSEAPGLAWSRWSRGSSLGGLCARLGRWACLKACVDLGGRPCEAARSELSASAAAFCAEACPAWPLGAAPAVLARALAAGAELDPEIWISLFGSSRAARSQAASCWAEAEAAHLRAACADDAGRAGAKRI